MDSSKFVILGANGQLGKALQAQYPDAIALDRSELDITNHQAVMSYDWSSVTHILNAAAYTNVDGAETVEGRRAAWAINCSAVASLAKVASEQNKILVHVSTDYVFDGSAELHTETEGYSPISFYGASKAAGDVAALMTRSYVLRTSWLIGEGKNFVRTMMSLAEKNISPTVVHDQVGRLTFTPELVRAIDHLLTNQCEYGVYNVSNAGESVSWADITRKIFTILGRDDLTVSNTTTAEYFAGKENIAPRPLQSTFDLSKIQSTGFASTDWEPELEKYVKGENS